MATKEEIIETFNRFLRETDARLKTEIGKHLIRAIFGKNALSE